MSELYFQTICCPRKVWISSVELVGNLSDENLGNNLVIDQAPSEKQGKYADWSFQESFNIQKVTKMLPHLNLTLEFII